MMGRARLRDLGIAIGRLPTGLQNAITDVPGVLVGHHTIVRDEPRITRTGVTAVLPHADIHRAAVFAGAHTLNGFGEMTGVHWINESGMLGVPVFLTGSHSLGSVYDAVSTYCMERGGGEGAMPVVAETFDGWLSSIETSVVQREHVDAALASASGGPATEGNVGGGTGMTCHGFKGGIGTSSRVVEAAGERYTVGALVQANYGERALLRVDGVPVGREIGPEVIPDDDEPPAAGGSIIILVATDAPLLGTQCRRLAQRASLGLARVGGIAHNGSGDIFLAFAVGNRVPVDAQAPVTVRTLPQDRMSSVFEATADAVEEAILNVLCAADTMTGVEGRTAHALPLDELRRVMRKYGRLA